MEPGTVETTTLASGLRPELLMQFLDELRDAGYSIGVQQYIAVQDLLLTLAAEGTWTGELTELHRLKRLIGPIVCSSITEQESFPTQFEQWVEQVKSLHYQPPLSEAQQAQKLEAELNELQREATWLRRGLVTAITILTIVLFPIPIHKAVLDTDELPSQPKPLDTQPGPASENPTVPDTVTPSETAQDNPATPNTTPALPEPLPEAEQAPTDAPVKEIDFSSLEAPDPPDSIFKSDSGQRAWLYLAAIGSASLTWRLWWNWQARLFLNRRTSHKSPELQTVSMQELKTSIFPSSLVFQTAQQLRQRTRQRVDTLDVFQTIQASLRKGGWFTPVYGYRQVIPEYLFLIDRASYADQDRKSVV